MNANSSSAQVTAFEDVHLGFETQDVLRGLYFALSVRETKVLVGESGSGKTLILKLAAGLLRPDAGRVFLLGQDLGALDEKDLLRFRRRVGFVFQEGALFDSINVGENVAFRLREEDVEEEEIESRVREALRFVELEEAMELMPADLSGGMRRRVSIARALVSRPEVVFYDSPTAGLDPITSQTIITLILRLRDLQGVSALMATHRLQDAFAMANYRFDKAANRVVRLPAASANGNQAPETTLLFIRGGRVYFEGEPQAVLDSPDPYLKEFLV